MTDTGPPYPRPVPGSANGIGMFQIGISPIGVMPAFDAWTTVISQYANSPILDAIITSFNAAMDPTENLQSLYDMVWNVLTAQGWGLDVWGKIVGLESGRTLHIPGAAEYLGFNEASGSWTGFNQGGFYTGAGTTDNYVLNDEDFRRLILAKAAGNISDGAIPSVNAILMRLFPLRGNAYVVDNQDMSLTYKFEFPLTAVELAIVQQANVLPNPAGVVINIEQS